MQEPTVVSHDDENVPSHEMKPSDPSTLQEPPLNQMQGSQPIYPALAPSVPPENVTHTPYPTTMMPSGQPPVMYSSAFPTTNIVTAQPPGAYPAYYPSVPANMNQQQPVYTTPMAPHQPPANLPPYPITTAPGPQAQFNSQQGYPTTVYGPQQQYPAYQNNNASMVTGQYAVAASQPKDYLCWSVLSMLFCFCPLGIVALVFSSKTSDAVVKQDWTTARRYSSRAFIFNFVSLMVGVICYIVIIAVRLG